MKPINILIISQNYSCKGSLSETSRIFNLFKRDISVPYNFMTPCSCKRILPQFKNMFHKTISFKNKALKTRRRTYSQYLTTSLKAGKQFFFFVSGMLQPVKFNFRAALKVAHLVRLNNLLSFPQVTKSRSQFGKNIKWLILTL